MTFCPISVANSVFKLNKGSLVVLIMLLRSSRPLHLPYFRHHPWIFILLGFVGMRLGFWAPTGLTDLGWPVWPVGSDLTSLCWMGHVAMRWPFSLHLKHTLVLARCFSFLESFVLFLDSMFDLLTWTRLSSFAWSCWGAKIVEFELFSSFFTMLSQLSWEGYTWSFLFNLIISILSSSTSRLSSSFSSTMRSSHDSVTTCSTQEFVA